MPPPSNLYLFGYNSLQTVGWAVSLFSILSSFISTGALHGGYASAGELICLLQIAAFLEVIHGAIGGLFIYLFRILEISGLVPSGVVLPLMQWGGRTHFLLAILQELPAVFITFLAWSLSEVISVQIKLHFQIFMLNRVILIYIT
ncbi:Protein-tyrosine phosphatase-like, PTPLA [Trema orientale]|uniref:Very-long-chain (3R)-3-hydroxyacyl-CoA dehydratase n=1 Tax=Trema orientale TaxID=63057 RepID=A0A2P5BUU4_TREOI|nr:Protein-tyrosine phosphatase-like, PTPLA [Trema orientale]